MANRKLTRKQQVFCDEYILDENATRAAKIAGYSDKTAYAMGAENLRKPQITEYIESRLKEIAKKYEDKYEVNAERVFREMCLLGLSNMQDYTRPSPKGEVLITDMSELTRDQAAAIQEITVEEYTDGKGEDARTVRRFKFKLHEKKGPLTLMGKHFGLFNDKVELTGPNGGPIQQVTVNTTPEEAARIYRERMS